MEDGRKYFDEGITYLNTNKYDEAIKCFQKALETHGYDTPGRAWNNMGIAYERKGDYDEAIKCFEKAVETPGYETPAGAWNNIGIAYGEKGDYDEAIKCFQKALDTPGYDTPGKAWKNMGIAYGEKGDYDAAIKYYQKALDAPGITDLGNVMHSLSDAYLEKNNIINAKKYLEDAITFYKENNDLTKLNMLSAKLDSISAKLSRKPMRPIQKIAEAISSRALKSRAGQEDMATSIQEDIRTTDIETREETLIGEVVRIMHQQDSAMKLYCNQPMQDNTYKPIPLRPFTSRSIPCPANYFLNLKGWSSNLPIVAELYNSNFADNSIMGGGYFIKWENKGIVVDPGLNFLDNFHFYKLHISDINIVLTTHNHIDHNMDLSRIIDLQREFNQGKHKNNRLNIQFYLDKDTYNSSIEMLKISRSTSHLHELRPDHTYDDVSKKFHVELSSFKTTHDDNLRDSVGLVLEFHDPTTDNLIFKLGITSDTKYSKEIGKRMRDCNAVIAHFSKTDENDLRGTEKRKMLKNHLGYMGVREIFKNTIADLCIAAEWSGALGDIRYELAELWKQDVKDTNKTIIPADIGFLFTIPEKKIRCTSCFNLVDKNKIRVGRPTVPFGRIMYYGPNCIS